MQKKILSLSCLVAAFMLMVSCKKEPAPEPEPETPAPPTEQASVKLEWYPVVDNEALIYNTSYLNPKGDTFSVKKLQYYISNVKLIREDNSTYSENESYHLMDHAVSTRTVFSVAGVPDGTYTSMRLMLGVDSLRNCSGAQTGDLDPVKGMFWTWNSGYIFFKLEGSAPASPQNKSFVYHVGGFTGENKTQREFTLQFATPLVVKKGAAPHIKMAVNINELFRNPNLVDFSTDYYQMTPGPKAKFYADNYSDMITVRSVHN